MGDRPASAMRKCASLPSLCLRKDSDHETEVYVTTRMLEELSSKIPKRFQGLVLDLGVAHYMVIVKTPAGALHRFDFGPVGGGDIAFGQAPQPPMAAMLGRTWRGGRRERAAEVRECKLTALPPLHMYVGRTQLSLDDIRSFNALQQCKYELHRNDCRHYVDRLCEYTTGVSEAAAQCKRQVFRQRRAAQQQWADSIMHVAHALTDAASWPRVQAATQATMAMAGAVMSRTTLRRLRPLRLAPPGLPVQAAAAPAPRALVRKLLQPQQRPLALATLLGASCTAGRQNPMVQAALGAGAGLGGGLCWSIRGALSSLASVPSGAAGGLQEVVSVTGRGMAAAMAAAGTRGAVQGPATIERGPVRERPRLALPQMMRPSCRESSALPALPSP